MTNKELKEISEIIALDPLFKCDVVAFNDVNVVFWENQGSYTVSNSAGTIICDGVNLFECLKKFKSASSEGRY